MGLENEGPGYPGGEQETHGSVAVEEEKGHRTLQWMLSDQCAELRPCGTVWEAVRQAQARP